MSFIIDFFSSNYFYTLRQFYRVYPVVLFVALVIFCWRTWKRYIISKFISELSWVMLEVKLPKETYKSPRAMEVVLSAFHQAPGINFYEENYLGQVRPWSSLEIVSINGSIHFFIRILSKFRVSVESHIYSQYPSAEVHEVSDYVTNVNYLLPDTKWDIFGTDFKLTKEDAYPIKTYVDFGLDKDPKEEFKVDPITSTLEFIGSVGPGEQVWMQILVMAAQTRFHKSGTWFKKQDWKDDAKTLLDQLMKRDKMKDTVFISNESLLSPGERTVLEAVERQISKIGFDCGIRMIYLAEADKFNPSNIGAMLGSLRQYNSLNLNGFKPTRVTKYEPWQDIFGRKIIKLKHEMFEYYCKRGWFYPPYHRVPFVLNTEELATLYHFPGAVAATPTFGRAESKRGEAPVNLPI